MKSHEIPQKSTPFHTFATRPALIEGFVSATSKVVSHTPLFCRLALLESGRRFRGRFGLMWRLILFKSIAKRCGSKVLIYEDVYLKNPTHAELGNNISIHPMSYIDATGGLTIGDDVSIAHGCTILTTEHDFSLPTKRIRNAPLILARVDIGSDVWLGAGVKILAGIKIGNRTVVGAGAVVTKDIDSGAVVVGIPARQIRSIPTTSGDRVLSPIDNQLTSHERG